MNDIQSTINELTKNTDIRTSVFEIEVQGLKNSTLTLGGRVLDASQLEELRQLLPLLKLETSAVRVLRREPGEKVHVATTLTGLYEKPSFGRRRASELTYGTELEVLDTEDQWVFTRQSDGYLGWVYRPFLSQGLVPQATHLVLTPASEVRAQPGDACEVVTRLVSGTAVTVEESQDDWSRITANRSGWLPTRNLRSLHHLPGTLEEKRTVIVEDAKRMVGVPYMWGGVSGNGIDGSGFARLLHRWIGIQIPRDADMQYIAAHQVDAPYESGDLFFFQDAEGGRRIAHVGVSLGGWNMIHSSRSNNGVYVDDLQQSPLMSTFISAGSFLRER
ncbi:MAG: NlpC/P60 family protein [Bacteroidota bacterium]